MRSLIVTILVLCSTPVFAQDLSGFEKIVLPTYNAEIRGEAGTQWRTILYAFNAGEPVHFFPQYEPSQPRSVGVFAARSFGSLILYYHSRFTGLGGVAPLSARLIYLERQGADNVTFHLEACPLSSEVQCEHDATEIPVVREKDFRTTRIDLIGISVRSDLRRRLRVFDPDRIDGAAVQVRLSVGGGSGILAERVIPLTVTTDSTGDQTYPGYAEIDLDRSFPTELASLNELSDRLVIEITPLTSHLRFWAMATVTDNRTQHITTITPH